MLFNVTLKSVSTLGHVILKIYMAIDSSVCKFYYSVRGWGMRDMSHRPLSLMGRLGQAISAVFKLWMLIFKGYLLITVKCFKNILDNHNDFVYVELFVHNCAAYIHYSLITTV